LTLFCVPYTFYAGLLPLLEVSAAAQAFFNHYSHIGFFFVRLILKSVIRFYHWGVVMHNKIRADKYMVGQRLKNVAPKQMDAR
jgi:E3 ubiquitin-protein ligase MARCH6